LQKPTKSIGFNAELFRVVLGKKPSQTNPFERLQMNSNHTSFVPYIGITDFMTREQTLSALALFQSLASGNIPHKLMVGVMMSYKTLHSLPTKWTNAFPANAEVADIFVDHPLAFNTLHYADYTSTDVRDSLTKAIGHGGSNINALQLDMVWPEPADIADAVVASGKRVSVILQVGQNAMAEAGDSPSEALKRLEDYAYVIDGVLLDKSMGQGKVMDVGVLLEYAEAIYKHMPNLRVAVAGGLGPVTTNVVEPLVSRFPDLSIDAQGRLRPSGSALDPIDWALANKYLEEAIKLFTKHRPDPWDLLIS